jgi:hypothetical protein
MIVIFGECLTYFVVDKAYFFVCGFSRNISVVIASLLFIPFWLFLSSL